MSFLHFGYVQQKPACIIYFRAKFILNCAGFLWLYEVIGKQITCRFFKINFHKICNNLLSYVSSHKIWCCMIFLCLLWQGPLRNDWNKSGRRLRLAPRQMIHIIYRDFRVNILIWKHIFAWVGTSFKLFTNILPSIVIAT